MKKHWLDINERTIYENMSIFASNISQWMLTCKRGVAIVDISRAILTVTSALTMIMALSICQSRP
jgi:hypothetical protein